jgi:hypothetical protein
MMLSVGALRCAQVGHGEGGCNDERAGNIKFDEQLGTEPQLRLPSDIRIIKDGFWNSGADRPGVIQPISFGPS